MRNRTRSGALAGLVAAFTLLPLLLPSGQAAGQTVSGYSEYILPGDELNMYYIFSQLDPCDATYPCTSNMHSVISVTAWTPNTRVYYDHWENGYGFDPANPGATADEQVLLANAGSVQAFESATVPNNRTPPQARDAALRCGGAMCYDGGDRIYVAGGAVTVTRAVWINDRGVGNQGDAWEIYPVTPQLTTYVVPFGEDLYTTSTDYFTGFERVYALIQAVEDGTTVTVDLNNDGTADILNQNRDATWNNAGDGTTVTLQKGQTFLLDRISACRLHATCDTAPGTLNTGAVITGNKTLQVKYVAGRVGQHFAARGLSAFPRGYWTTDYYAPYGQAVACNKGITDYYLFNPGSTPLTVNWQSQTTSGSFVIAANSTQSFNRAQSPSALPSVPQGSGLYFSASSPFWGVGFGDATNAQTACGAGTPSGQSYEWGFSLLPTSLLSDEHYFGWAPGSLPLTTAPTNGNGAYLTAAQDNVRVFVDYDNDGTADQTYTLSRLQSQFIPAGPTGDLKGARIWGTGLFTLAYGENADTANTPTPSLDIGYVALPASDFVSLVLTTSKTANPAVVGTAIGSFTDFTIKVNTKLYPLDTVGVVDTLPPSWQFVPGFTTITKPDLTQTTSTAAIGTVTTNGTTAAVVGTGTTFTSLTAGSPITINGVGYLIQSITNNTNLTLTRIPPAVTNATYYTLGGVEPAITGAGPYVLTWSSAQTGGTNMAANQEITVKFRAATTAALAAGTISQNRVVSTGTRTVGTGPGSSQTFTAADFAFVATGSSQITKTSNAAVPLYPGDKFTYTVTLPNPGAAGTNLLTGISLYDALPSGLSSVAGTTTLSHSTVADSFSSRAYNLNVGTRNWSGDWTELLDTNGGATNGSPTQGNIQVTAGGELQLSNAGSLEPSLSRAVSLTGATTAILSFRYRTTAGVDAADSVLVQAGTNGVAGAFTTVATLTGNTGVVTGTLSVSLSTYISATSAIRFTFPNGGFQQANEFYYVDDVSITYNVSVAGANPPELISAGSLYATVGGQTITATFDATVNSPFPTGQTSVTNTAATTSVQLPIQLTASKTDIVENPGAQSATVAGRIWLDSDGGADQDLGEPGIANVQVTLKDSFGTPVATGVTDSNGRFLFSGVTPGNGYYVEATAPPNPGGLPLTGLTQTFPTAGSNYKTTVFNLAAGQDYTQADQGYRPAAGSAIFGDLTWVDSNANGIRDAGEVGLGGVPLRLYRDFNGDGLLNPLVDTFVPTPVTGPGTLAVTNGSTTVTGTGTAFRSLGIGDPITIGGVQYTIATIPSDTSLTLTAAYTGTTATGLVSVVTSTTGTGTVTVANGSATVTGTGTTFTNLSPGDPIKIGGVAYRVLSVASNTSLTLTTNATVAVTNGPYGVPVPTTSDPDGSYLFTGVTPTGLGQTYFVAAKTPSGYTATGPTGYKFVDVASGSANLTADFGYTNAASTYTLTDRVWLDNGAGGGTASNGLRDGTEAGIGGVTVDLLDRSLNVIGTTTTAADGTFTFSGLTGGGADYTTRITDTGGVLTGYFGTTTYATAGQRLEPNVTASFSRAAAPSYGFNTTRAIGDTVYNDLNGNGVQDAGEPGLPGVVVSLYKSVDGDGVIDMAAGAGTVTTTAGSTAVVGTGTSFLNYHAGEPITIGGVVYAIQSVTDATHLTLTTNAAANTGVAYRAPSAGPGTVSTAIGSPTVTGVGTSFLNYKAGEPITINGVVYSILSVASNTSLTLTTNATAANTNTANFYGPGDALLATVTTDANGQYIFAGLPNRSYVVSVQDIPGYNYIPGTRTDTDNGANSFPGTQLAATITGTGNILDRDFGFQAITARGLSGRVWNDKDNNAAINGTDTGLQGVTLDILLNGTTVVGTVTTDSSGNYSVSGLSCPGDPCNYTVRVTDTGGVLASFNTTFEYGGGLPFDGQSTSVNLFAGNVANINFGYYHPTPISPTHALVRSMSAMGGPRGVELRWQTSYEVDNLGFRVFREENGERTAVGPSLVAGSALLVGPQTKLSQGRAYRWTDTTPADSSVRYWLEAIDLNGERTTLGPVFVEARKRESFMEGLPQAALLETLGRESSVETARPGISADASTDEDLHGAFVLGSEITVGSPSMRKQRELAAGAAAKIGVKEEGWYSVSLGSLIAAGFDPGSNPDRLQLFADGLEVPILVRDGGGPGSGTSGSIEFYGTPIDTPYSGTHVYWLVRGNANGQRVRLADTEEPGEAAASSFPFTVERKERTVYFAALTNNGENSNFFGPVVSGTQLDQTLTLSRLDRTAVASWPLQVTLQGVTTDTEHAVEVFANGRSVGTISFKDQEQPTATFPVPTELLVEGTNTVSLVARGGSSDVSLVDSVRLTYPHLLVADGGALKLRAASGATLAVSGFSDSSVRVFDVTSRFDVSELRVTTSGSAASFEASAVVPEALRSTRTLLAVAPSRVLAPASITMNQPSSLHSDSGKADLAVISNGRLLEAATALKSLRESQGLTVKVVDVDDIYDEFSFGHKSPQAIKDFLLLQSGFGTRYALFFGDASMDPRNYLGKGDFDLVPTKLVATRLLKTASDDWFVDFDDNGLPEMATGRLAVRTATEAVTVVSKLKAHDRDLSSPDAWRKKVVQVADQDDPPEVNPFPFEKQVETLGLSVPAGLSVENVLVGQMAGTAAHDEIVTRLNAGAMLVTYIGHGSQETWSKSKVFSEADVEALTNGSKLPVLIAMNCLNGLFIDTDADSLAEAFQKAPNGGAAAVWASSSLTSPAPQSLMTTALYNALFSSSSVRLGDAMNTAKAASKDPDVRRTWILFGDPTMKLR